MDRRPGPPLLRRLWRRCWRAPGPAPGHQIRSELRKCMLMQFFSSSMRGEGLRASTIHGDSKTEARPNRQRNRSRPRPTGRGRPGRAQRRGNRPNRTRPNAADGDAADRAESWTPLGSTSTVFFVLFSFCFSFCSACSPAPLCQNERQNGTRDPTKQRLCGALLADSCRRGLHGPPAEPERHREVVVSMPSAAYRGDDMMMVTTMRME